ncbi:hypothetical protein GCM10025331_60450 [Actinoplanes utahensis]|nr:hypothetical protein Aut01nite_76130 [Actinoplanes utahensis]
MSGPPVAPEHGGFPGAPGMSAGPAGFGGPPGVPGHGGFAARRPDWRQFMLQGSTRPWRRTLRAGLGVAVAVALLGVFLGLAWGWLAPTVPVVDAGESGILVTDPSPEQYIAADGWFTLLGLGFGLIVAVGAWLALRRDRGPALLIGVVAGAYVAGRWVAPAAGEFLGRGAYEQWMATAARGATYLAPPEVQAAGPKLVPAFVAAIVLTLLAGWSNDPDLDLPGAQPGYGPNHAYPPPYDAPPPYAPQVTADHTPPARTGSPYAPQVTADHTPPARTGSPYAPSGAATPYAPPAGGSPHAPSAGAGPEGSSHPPPVGTDPTGASYGPPPVDPTAASGADLPPSHGGEQNRRDS